VQLAPLIHVLLCSPLPIRRGNTRVLTGRHRVLSAHDRCVPANPYGTCGYQATDMRRTRKPIGLMVNLYGERSALSVVLLVSVVLLQVTGVLLLRMVHHRWVRSDDESRWITRYMQVKTASQHALRVSACGPVLP
jgi:hypothetical protein